MTTFLSLLHEYLFLGSFFLHMAGSHPFQLPIEGCNDVMTPLLPLPPGQFWVDLLKFFFCPAHSFIKLSQNIRIFIQECWNKNTLYGLGQYSSLQLPLFLQQYKPTFYPLEQSEARFWQLQYRSGLKITVNMLVSINSFSARYPT